MIATGTEAITAAVAGTEAKTAAVAKIADVNAAAAAAVIGPKSATEVGTAAEATTTAAAATRATISAVRLALLIDAGMTPPPLSSKMNRAKMTCEDRFSCD